MAEKQEYPAETTHPETGERMVLDTSQGVDAMKHRLERNIGIAQGGAEALAKVREKETDEGRIYVNPITGYRARLKPGAARSSSTPGAPAQTK